MAADWPKGYDVAEDSTSPDQRFALVIPGRDTLGNDDEEKVNYLADVKAHHLLGKIHGADYTWGENHRGLNVWWSSDSARVLLDYEGRYGFDQLMVLEPRPDGFAQSDLSKFVHGALNAAIARQPHGKDLDCFGEVFCRWTPDGKLRLRVLGQTNPKQLETSPTYSASFQGTYDPKARKWTAVESHPVNDLYDELGALFRTPNFANRSYNREEDRADALDHELNDTYQALKSILPADRFAQVKKDQIAWLKTRDAAATTKAKCELLEARIKALQELAW